MGIYEIGNILEPELSIEETFVILTNEDGFLEINASSLGDIEYDIRIYKVDKELVDNLKI